MTEFAGVEISPQSRFSVHNVPALEPGKCCLCGAADSDRQYVDFGFQLDWYGAVYFCTHCFIEAAETVGFVPTVKLNSVSQDIENARKELSEVKEEYRSLQNAVRISLRNCECFAAGGGDVLPLGDAPALEGGSEADDSNAGKSPDDGKARRSK